MLNDAARDCEYFGHVSSGLPWWPPVSAGIRTRRAVQTYEMADVRAPFYSAFKTGQRVELTHTRVCCGAGAVTPGEVNFCVQPERSDRLLINVEGNIE